MLETRLTEEHSGASKNCRKDRIKPGGTRQEAESRDDNPHPEGNQAIAQNFNGYGTPDYFLNVSANHPPRVLLSAQLRQVPPRGHAKPGREELDQKPHGCCPHKKPKQGVPGDGPSLEIPLQVTGVQERNAHQESRPREQPQLPPREGRGGVARATQPVIGIRDLDDNLLFLVVGPLLFIVFLLLRFRGSYREQAVLLPVPFLPWSTHARFSRPSGR
ncbi:unnamed protein product [Spirodela intermedia]|uniref:Uncharacterized protein n=2 Tax=Spirodela intermedia TaxID=51605 RepID=A0A7I8K8S7_SPIIN|nr:unnamed protein product [Spirodela intermedia]CAA6657481.1 unnamed protein product [Spirodela intermedia]CAA7393547.1 unnamed protein product [Spirodela intermedia]